MIFMCAGPDSGNLTGSIIAFKLEIQEASKVKVFVESPGTQFVIKPIDKVTNQQAYCSGRIPGNSLKMDKFGNLLFIREDKRAIVKVPRSDLKKVFNLKERTNIKSLNINVTCEVLYSNDTTAYIYALQGITLEREYLYWSNDLVPTN